VQSSVFSNLVGKNQEDQIKAYIKVGNWANIIQSGLVVILAGIFAHPLMKIYSNDEEVINMAIPL